MNDKKVIYQPPPDETFYKLARRICEERAKRDDDPSLLQHEIVGGLARYLIVVARIQAKHLNKQE